MNADLIDRLVCAKFLYQSGIEALERDGPFSAGLGVLSFHDAAELALRAVASKLEAKTTDYMQFSQLLDNIEEVAGTKISLRAELLKLNRMRVSFKHSAILPRSDDVRRIQHALDSFFVSLVRQFFSLDFDEISLVGLVRHTRTANWLRTAESQLSRSEFASAIEAAAKAFAVFMNSRKPPRRSMNLLSNLRATEPRGTVGQDISVRKAVHKLAHDTEEEIQEIWDHLDLIDTGVDLAGYRRYLDLVPRVRLSQGRTFWILDNHRPHEVGYDDALFCVNFAISTILKAQTQYRKPAWIYRADRAFRVDVDTQIIVHPLKNESENEMLFIARIGTTLSAPDARFDMNEMGYTAVLHDGQIAYAKTETLSELTSAASSV